MSRIAMAVACFTCIALGQTPTQLKDQKRVTALQIGEGAEGARVTIIADSALNDYEAFRRGDHFYVRIPLAEFAAAQPTFQGDGFDNVQVQRIGDSVVVSFKLQPGASARVDEGNNRLDVIFTAPARLARNNAAVVRGRTVASKSSRRSVDAAGPVPPGSPVFDDSQSSSEASSFADTQVVSSRRGLRDRSQAAAKETAQGGDTLGAVPSPTVLMSSSTSSTYPPVTSATPWTTVQTNVPVLSNKSSNSRTDAALQWAKTNRVAILVGSLVLSAVTAFSLLMLRRRKVAVKTKRGSAPKVQPKYSLDQEFEDIFTGQDDSDVAFQVSEPWHDQVKASTFISNVQQHDVHEQVGRVTEPTLEPVEAKFYWEEQKSDNVFTPYAGYEKWEENEREVIEL